MQRKNKSLRIGLAALLGILPGCGNRFGSEGLPANNYLFGRQMEVSEEDMQHPENNEHNSLTFPLRECSDGSHAEVFAMEIPDKNGRPAPFDVEVQYNTESIATFRFTDNENDDFVNGEIWTVNSMAGCYGINDSRIQLYVTVGEGRGNASLDDHVDDLEDRVPGFYIGDSVCEEKEGENHTNSQYDCPAPEPTDPALDELLNKTYTEITDKNGKVISPINMSGNERDFAVRLYMPKSLETKIGAPTSLVVEELGYTGTNPADCFTIKKYGSLARVGEEDGFAVYQAPFTLSRTPNCNQDYELIQAKIGLKVGNGQVSFNDSEEAVYTGN